MILGVHHTALAVPDMDAALGFYQGVLGFETVMEAELPSGIEIMQEALGVPDSGFKVRMVKKGNSILELFEYAQSEPGHEARPPNRIGITHICVCSDDIVVDYDRLAEGGVTFNADLLGGPGDRFAYGRDPFGNVIELLEHNPEAANARDFSDRESSAA